jgi:hypothetical protein
VYCTARIDAAANPSGHADRDLYLKALLAAGNVDHVEYGTYAARMKTAPLTVKDPQGRPGSPARPGRSWSRTAAASRSARPCSGLLRQSEEPPTPRPRGAVPAS